jgi:ADP-dependent phosphofructokinase/glucokinase
MNNSSNGLVRDYPPSQKPHRLSERTVERVTEMTHWESLYESAYQRGIQKIQAIKGITCAFHSVLDGFIRLTPTLLNKVFEEYPELKEDAKKGLSGVVPDEILTPADFICGLFFSLRKGSACQRMIRTKETYQWALKMFGHGQLRLGGTSANMARSLVPLGIPVNLYANPLTKELAELMGDYENLSVIVKNEHRFKLEQPKRAAIESGIFAIHWIFEYGANFEYTIDHLTVKPGRANRYIPSWNPRNNQFKMSKDFEEGFFTLTNTVSHLLFSGFHILSEQYPDGATCDDVIRPLGDFLQKVRLKAPHIRIHLEMACISTFAVRESLINWIFPHIHSVGLNETELPLLYQNLGADRSAEAVKENPGVLDYANAIHTLMSRTGVNRVHFHNLGYYLCLEKTPWNNHEDTRDALLFAAIMAAARARNGLFSSLEDIGHGLKQDVSEAGLSLVKQVADELRQPQIELTGMGTYKAMALSLIPTKVVVNPLFTVGLGDTISSGALLTE